MVFIAKWVTITFVAVLIVLFLSIMNLVGLVTLNEHITKIKEDISKIECVVEDIP